ncbi:hypothetical protein, partial [Bacteroides caecimuris]|uniref:hypothetical protein n=1 Tax=Bacteroides caecimuris TaxID=1796613 RepID=UPI0026587EF0
KRICTSPVMVDYLFLYSCYRLTGKDTMRNENQQRSACRCAKSRYIIINQRIESKIANSENEGKRLPSLCYHTCSHSGKHDE